MQGRLPFVAHSQLCSHLALPRIYGWSHLCPYKNAADSVLDCRSKHEETITTYVEAVNYLLRHYVSHVVISRDIERIRVLQQGSLTPLHFLQKLWDLTLPCDGVDNKQMLRRFFVAGIDLSIRSNICGWRAVIQEATFEDLTIKPSPF